MHPFLEVIYHVRGDARGIAGRAAAIAVEQSVEMPVAAIDDAFVRAEIVGEVAGIVPKGGDLFEVRIRLAVETVGSLDVLINNAGVAIYDDLSNLDVVEQHLQVNFLGMLRVTHAFVPLLKRSHGAIVNNLSLAALAALPMIPAYSISKAAAFNMTQSLRALLASEGVSVHGVVLGPVDTDMNRGLEIPKASPESAAAGIFDGLARGEEEIFPDPASRSIADGWRIGVVKGLERQFAVFAPENAASLG